jgi:F-type H+-transporting ATPase subunit a
MNLPNLFAMLQGGGAAAEAAHEATGETPDVAGMLMHHLLDGNEIEFEILGRGFVWHLPHWEPVHVAGLTLDFSPTRHVVFIVLAALLCLAVFIPVAGAIR